MNQKILPITYPTITTFTGYANALAILQSHEEALDWVYSQYIQIYIIRNEIVDINKEYATPAGYLPSFFGDFDNRRLSAISCDDAFKNQEIYPYINAFNIPVTLFDTDRIIDRIKRCIDNEMYVYTYINTLNIEAYGRTAETTDFNGHPIFIYGYDDKSETFNIADFFQGGKYSFEECSFAEMTAALSSEQTDILPLGGSTPYFSAIQYKTSKTFRFDMDYIRKSISEYLYPSQTQTEQYTKYVENIYDHLNWKMSAIIGNNAYDFLFDFAKMYIALEEFGVTGIDVRPFHALFDHKVMMAERLTYFLKKGYLSEKKLNCINEYATVKDKATIVRGLILKYNANPNGAILERLDKLLAETKDSEITLLKEIFDV